MSNVTVLHVDPICSVGGGNLQDERASLVIHPQMSTNLQRTSSRSLRKCRQPSHATFAQSSIRLYIPCDDANEADCGEEGDHCDGGEMIEQDIDGVDEPRRPPRPRRSQQAIYQLTPLNSAHENKLDHRIKLINYCPPQPNPSQVASQSLDHWAPPEYIEDGVFPEVRMCDASTCTTSDMMAARSETHDVSHVERDLGCGEYTEHALSLSHSLSLCQLYQNGVLPGACSYVISGDAAGVSVQTSQTDEQTDSGLDASECETSVSPELSGVPECGLTGRPLYKQSEPSAEYSESNASQELDRDEEYVVVSSEKVGIIPDICSLDTNPAFDFTKPPLTQKLSTSSSDSVFQSECCSSNSENLSNISIYNSQISEENPATSVPTTLWPLTRENLRLLEVQRSKGSPSKEEDSHRLLLPASLLELGRRLHVSVPPEAIMSGVRSQACQSAANNSDLYTVLGGTVRGYPASWTSLGSRFASECVGNDEASTDSGGEIKCQSSELPAHVKGSAADSASSSSRGSDNGIEDWTVGRRRGISTGFSHPARSAATTSSRALTSHFPNLDNNKSNKTVASTRSEPASDSVEEDAGDDWYPRCSGCRQQVYPQDTVRLASGLVYHAFCLSCHICQQTAIVVDREKFVRFDREQRPVCPNHGSDRSHLIKVQPEAERIGTGSRSRSAMTANVPRT